MGAYRQTGPYMPDADGPFSEWLKNFAGLIYENPHRFGLDKSDGTILNNIYTSYRDAYDLVCSPKTRTSSNIAAKDAIEASARATCRTYAGLIRTNMGVPNSDLIELGMKARNYSRARIPAPRSAPVLTPICAYPLQTCLRFADESGCKGKPKGVTTLELCCDVVEPGQPLPTMPSMKNGTIRVITRRSPIFVDHRPEDACKTAAFWAWWRTRSGLDGPLSLPTYFTVCAGGATAQSDAAGQMRAPELNSAKRQKAA